MTAPSFITATPLCSSLHQLLPSSTSLPRRRPRYNLSTQPTPRRATLHSTTASSQDNPSSSSSSPPSSSSSPLTNSKSNAQSSATSNGVSSNNTSLSETPSAPTPTPEPDDSSILITLGSRSFSIPARWLLFSVPFLWGSFGPAVRLIFAQNPHQGPAVFNSERLLLSSLVYLPVLWSELQAYQTIKKTSPKQPVDSNRFAFVPAGIELGFYVFLANVAQVIGLQQTSASRAAFLVQLQTVFVPVLSGLFGIDKISPRTWLSSLIAIGGVALLSSDKGHGTVSSLFGDSLEVLSALFFSTYIIRLGNFCNRVSPNPLVAVKIITQALLSVGWAVVAEAFVYLQRGPAPFDPNAAQWTLGTIAIAAGAVAWTGLVSSALSGWAQTKGQQKVPASEAVVIFATQPLWASALATVFLGETFGASGIAGGALIIVATLIASVKGGEKKDDD